MKTSKALLATVLFCAPPLRADDPATIPPPSPGAAVAPGASATTGENPSAGSTDTNTSGRRPWTTGGGGGVFGSGGFGAAINGNGGAAFFDGNNVRIGNWSAGGDRPALITTQAMDTKALNQWKEDLNVMDKLLRDEIARVAGDFTPRAMGIALRFAGSSSPMYVEGSGAIFSGSVSVPLAAGDGTGKTDEKGNGDSPWERAKMEIDIANGHQIRITNGRQPEAIAKFDQTKLDSLTDAIVKILPEANHIRSLKPDESVIVTLTGTDDSGSPLRLTLKAKKSDIDDASSGKIKPEEFKPRVTQRIGG
jgi:hypothetical protein